MQRNMGKDDSFSNWMESRNRSSGENSSEESESLLSQWNSIQDGFAAQMNEMAGSLPDAGPLSADFRGRVSQSVYLLLGSILFAIMGIVVGLPTVALRPSKFIMCTTISTLLGIASVVVMRKPMLFIEDIIKKPLESFPLVALIISSFFTIYVTVAVHKYIMILAAGGVQVFCMLWYISTFIPGGRAGLNVLLKTMYYMVTAAMAPCFAFGRYAMSQMLS